MAPVVKWNPAPIDVNFSEQIIQMVFVACHTECD